jgi:heat shock protein HtpX
MDNLNNFQCHTTDWRQSIKINGRRTVLVIVTYLLIYGFIGLLFDLYMASRAMPQMPLPTLMTMLLTFQIKPVYTLGAMVVAAICVYITFACYKKLMLLGTDYFEITPTTARSVLEQQIYNVVEEMKIAASMPYMPRVFIIEANYMNAFASGFSNKSAMIAITRGLAEKLNRAELQAVLAHELSHIRHMDIRLTLFASVLSNLILMCVDALFWSALSSNNRGREEGRSRNQLFLLIMILRFLLPLITLLLQLYLSRTREYMADSGAVELMRDNHPLAQALLKIHQDHEAHQGDYQAAYQSTAHEQVRSQAYIYDPSLAGIGGLGSGNLFSTHPSIAARLKALGFSEKQ